MSIQGRRLAVRRRSCRAGRTCWLAAALVAGAGAIAVAGGQPRAFTVALQEGRTPDGTVVAIRAVMGGEAAGTCGDADAAEWSRVGQVLERPGARVTYSNDALGCEITVTWQPHGSFVTVRGREASTDEADSPADRRGTDRDEIPPDEEARPVEEP
jgi:hypothetical protein